MTRAAPPFRGVVVAKVQSVEPHPNADRLRVCAVDVGSGEPLSIVCGAPNVRAGMKAPCALVGAELPPAKEGSGEPFRIEVGKIRGVESRGMLCSARELKLSDDHEGLLVLDDDAVVGTDVRAALGLDDTIFTLKLTPNLGHALSVFGVAREVAAITGAPLKTPSFPKARVESDAKLPVKVEAADLCGRFSGRVVTGVDPRAKTPRWMVDRLARCGQRSVSPLVDISNYVMFEFGRPSHIFDLDKIESRLVVRWGRPGEALELLNGSTVEVDDDRRRHRRRGARRVARRHHGRRGDRGVGCDAQRLRRGRVLVARGGRRPVAPLPLLDRRRPSLRARRRSGDDGRPHRAHDGADRRHLRQRRHALRSGRRPRRRAAAADARHAARRARRQGDRHAGHAGRLRARDGAPRLRVHFARRRDRRRSAELALRPADRGRPDRGGHPPDRLRAIADRACARHSARDGEERAAAHAERDPPCDGRPRLAGDDQLQLRRRALGARLRRQRDAGARRQSDRRELRSDALDPDRQPGRGAARQPRAQARARARVRARQGLRSRRGCGERAARRRRRASAAQARRARARSGRACCNGASASGRSTSSTSRAMSSRCSGPRSPASSPRRIRRCIRDEAPRSSCTASESAGSASSIRAGVRRTSCRATWSFSRSTPKR